MKARPVYVDVRELAWTSVLGISLPNETTELILWVKTDVPEVVFMDEVYCTRILMNLVRYTVSSSNLIPAIQLNSHQVDILLLQFHSKAITLFFQSKIPASASAKSSLKPSLNPSSRRTHHSLESIKGMAS